MDYLLSLWEGLPWWVGLLLLVLLAAYALVRAGYELWKEEEGAREEAQAQLQKTEQEHEGLRRENERLKRLTEEPRSLEDHRRKRIEEWRRVISRFDFTEIGGFGRTNTYSEM